MRKKIYIAVVTTSILLISGLLYNLFNGYKEINNSFYINKQLNKIKAHNQDLNLLITNLSNFNYDKVQKTILDIDVTIKDILIKFNDKKLHKLRQSFNQRKEIIENLKSTNSVLSNSYRNSLKLRKEAFKYLKSIKEYQILGEVVQPVLSSVYINNIDMQDQLESLQQLQQEFYNDNIVIELLISNVKIYKKYFYMFNDLVKKNEKIQFNQQVDNIIRYYEIYNKDILYRASLIIGIFVLLLVLFLITMLILSSKLDDKIKDVQKLNEDLDKYVIVSKTNLHGVITYASEAFCNISGYNKDELIGNPHNIVRHPDMEKQDFSNMWNVISNNDTWKGEVKNLKKDGGYYWVNAVISPIYNQKNIKIGYSSIRQDITDSKKIKELNKTLNDKVKLAIDETKQKEKLLQQQSRLAQMGEMISMIAHQWRQPLGAISTTTIGIETKLILKKFDLSNEDDRDKFQNFLSIKLKDINGFVQSLSTTIDDFRNFFKPEKDKEIVSLVEPINRALKIVETSMSSKGINISCNFNNDEKLLIYQNEVMQVILNILKNSEDNFIEKKIINPQIKITTLKSNNNYIIDIYDNGGGIAEDILPKIFDPYFSTKDEKNGTGLGLYMSKIIIEEHNSGKLIVENIDDGICFKIILGFVNDKNITKS